MKLDAFAWMKLHQQKGFRRDRVTGWSNNHPEGLSISGPQALTDKAVTRHGRHLRWPTPQSHQIKAGMISLIKVERCILKPKSCWIVLWFKQRSTDSKAGIPHINGL